MGYKEKLKSYAEGKLEGKEKEKVESDIDRQRAIGDYLEESIDGDIFEEGKEEKTKPAGEDGGLSKLVQKAVSRKLKKFGIWTGAVVLAVTIFLMFGLSPLVDAMYYDPGEKLPGPDDLIKKIDMPLAVYTELHCPGRCFAGAKVEDEGFAKYGIKLTLVAPCYSSNLFTPQVYQFTIDKGKMQSDRPDWRDLRPWACFNRLDRDPGYTLESSSEANAAKLEKLPETTMVTVAFTFKDDLSLDVIDDFRSDETIVAFVPVKTSEEDGDYPTPGKFGFSPPGWGVIPFITDMEDYPDLFIEDTPLPESGWTGAMVKEIWERHFKSMLKFMDDQKEFRQVINYSVNQAYQRDYASALKYVEENGVKTYGVIVYGPVSEILRMAKDDRVKWMYVMDA